MALQHGVLRGRPGGGTLALVDGAGAPRDAAVFTATDAGPEGRYVQLHP